MGGPGGAMIESYYTHTGYVLTWAEGTTEYSPDLADANYSTGETFVCALETVSGSERYAVGSETVLATHRVYCTAGVSVTEQNRVQIGSTIYTVVFVENPMERSHHKEVMLRVVR